MTAEHFVDVRYRGIEIGARARFYQVSGRTAYVEVSAPMPVGTELMIDDGDLRVPVRVLEVFEQVAGLEQPPGMRVVAFALDDDERSRAWWRARGGEAGESAPTSAVDSSPESMAAADSAESAPSSAVEQSAAANSAESAPESMATADSAEQSAGHESQPLAALPAEGLADVPGNEDEEDDDLDEEDGEDDGEEDDNDLGEDDEDNEDNDDNDDNEDNDDDEDLPDDDDDYDDDDEEDDGLDDDDEDDRNS